MTAPSAPLVCDIAARDASHSSVLAAIAATCAHDVAIPLSIRRRISVRAGREATLTLRLPAGLAAAQHSVWCLACRLACFCPQARVSVLVECDTAFGSTPSRSRHAA